MRHSSGVDRRNTSSQSIRRHTTPSIISAISTGEPIKKSFELHQSMLGKPPVPPPDHRSLIYIKALDNSLDIKSRINWRSEP
jgi:hypothetical protein